MKGAKTTEARVYYADTDHGGAVYYANYLRWFEVGRTELLRSRGITQDQLDGEGMLLPVVEVKCSYRHPARYDDVVVISTSIERIGNSSITFAYAITRKGDNKLLAEGHTINVLAKGTSSVPFPEKMRSLLTEDKK